MRISFWVITGYLWRKIQNPSSCYCMWQKNIYYKRYKAIIFRYISLQSHHLVIACDRKTFITSVTKPDFIVTNEINISATESGEPVWYIHTLLFSQYFYRITKPNRIPNFSKSYDIDLFFTTQNEYLIIMLKVYAKVILPWF